MSKSIRVGELAEAVSEALSEYKDAATEDVKKAVRDAGKTIKGEINTSAPVRTGKYAASWRSKVTAEDSQAIQVTVHSPTRYQIAHLLEHGHAKRNGGRVRAIPHIGPAEEIGVGQLMKDLEKALKG